MHQIVNHKFHLRIQRDMPKWTFAKNAVRWSVFVMSYCEMYH